MKKSVFVKNMKSRKKIVPTTKLKKYEKFLGVKKIPEN